MLLTLQRRASKGGATIGELFLDGVHESYTLEDEIREIPGAAVVEWKVDGKTAIPTGKYRIAMTRSPRFGKVLPLLLDVPGSQAFASTPGTRPNTLRAVFSSAQNPTRTP